MEIRSPIPHPEHKPETTALIFFESGKLQTLTRSLFFPPEGIMGKEGRQAVRCSDFGFAKFRFLKKMLLVHGHWNYVRVSVFVQFSFYKNVAFNTPIVFYSIWNAFSTQVLSYL